MSKNEKALPISTSDEYVLNGDGSVTRTTTTTYTDGSKTREREPVTLPEKSPDKEQATTSAPIEPRGSLYITSIVLYAVAALFEGVLSAFCFGSLFNRFLLYGCIISILIHLIALSLMQRSASFYVKIRQSQGNKNCMITSWFLFALSSLAIVIFVGNKSPELCDTTLGFRKGSEFLFLSLLVLLNLPGLCMTFHVEEARAQDTTNV